MMASQTAILRIAFGLIWAINAGLKWQPSFLTDYMSYINQAGESQPHWLGGWFGFWSHVMATSPRLFAILVAIIETTIALALIAGFARRTLYVGGTVFSLLLWAIPQGLGGPYTSSSTDVGGGIIYALVFVALYLLERSAVSVRWTIDGYMVKKWPWWAVIANP